MLPSSSVPQTGRHPGLMSRKSQQASDSVLSHPMLWLDERIFGWNRSAGVAHSVWGVPHSAGSRDRSRSNPPTAPGSPADSEDEQEEADVDYDDVLAVIEHRRNGSGGGDGWPESPRGGRKRGGKSYVDMQNLREGRYSPMSPKMVLPEFEGEDGNKLMLRKKRNEKERESKEGGQVLGLELVNGDHSKGD
jgi:glycerol-3-phosphate O-acyltransferase/dihydroxyacetone phosphate acyltransferase